MNDAKYIGLDVHQSTICAAVLDSAGNLVMEAILETKTETILQFLGGIRGSLHVTFEEGTWAAWLHDLLKPHVTRVVVCDTRKTGIDAFESLLALIRVEHTYLEVIRSNGLGIGIVCASPFWFWKLMQIRNSIARTRRNATQIPATPV
jgi:hypothetical protein